MKPEFFVPLSYTLKHSNKHFIGSILINCWIPIYAILALGLLSNLNTYLELIIYFIAFAILYEIGYIYTDNIAHRWEDKTIRRDSFYKDGLSNSTIALGIAIRVAALVLIFSTTTLFTLHIQFIYLCSIGLYILHGLLKEKFRVATLIALRTIKGYAPYAFLIELLTVNEEILIMLALVGTAIYHAIPYVIRKTRGTSQVDLMTIQNSYLRIYIVIPLFLIAGFMFTIPLLTIGILSGTVIAHHALFVIGRIIINNKPK